MTTEVRLGAAAVAILGTRYPDLSIEREALEHFGVELRVADGADRDEILATASDAELILAGSRPRFDASTITGLRCRAIVRYGVGVDSIDLEAAAAAGLWVVRVSDYGVEPVAHHAVTLALAGTRRLIEADRRVKDGFWGFGALRPLRLPSALTAGVVGFGRIGRRVATHLTALGFRMLAHDPFVSIPGELAEAVDLPQLLERADVVTLHAPGLPDRRAVLDGDALGRMKPGAVLVNTGRGTLIDERALVRGLEEGRPGLAALDVYETEPPDVSRFEKVIDRVILTPHMAWYTEESELDMRRQTVAEAVRLLRGEDPLDAVVRPSEETPPCTGPNEDRASWPMTSSRSRVRMSRRISPAIR
jgi:D-3-phosphoglycerate dehydrogenase / 2-oxoglutarate reductase